MIKIYLSFIAILLFSLCQSCSGIFSVPDHEANEMERADHQYCISLGLDFGRGDPLNSELYWRCRNLLAKEKITINASSPRMMTKNEITQDLKNKLSTQFEYSFEDWNNARTDYSDKNDHKKCIAMGFVNDSDDAAKTEDYYNCRRKLIFESQIIPPYHNTDYFRRPADSYNSAMVINKKIDRDLEEIRQAYEKYPNCKKFKIKTANFINCGQDYERKEICHSKIIKQKFLKEFDGKITCQRQAYVRFPDYMLKLEKKDNDEIERDKKIADRNNKNSFTSLGIGDDALAQFAFSETVDKKNDKNNKNEKAKKVDKKFDNSSNQLYSKMELTLLRQKFIRFCQLDVDEQIQKYETMLKDSCNSIVLKWEEIK